MANHAIIAAAIKKLYALPATVLESRTIEDGWALPSHPYVLCNRQITKNTMPNTSLDTFDSVLLSNSHYRAYPAMLPYVGADYDSPFHPRLLILGESFYFPEESTIHKVPDEWYASNQSHLTDDEVSYIHCRGLVECNWDAAGHKMYREINASLRELNYPTPDRPISHACFTNTFLRPASISGQSFMHCCTNRDIYLSLEVLSSVLSTLSPHQVIFASKYGWDSVGVSLAKQFPNMIFDFVSHPADPFHWNVQAYPHGRNKFMSLLKRWAGQKT